MLSKLEIKQIRNHIRWLKDNVDLSKPAIIFSGFPISEHASIKDFHQKVVGTNNPLIFDNSALEIILDGIN